LNSQNAATASSNRRNQYLFQTLNLDHDPFAFASTELELPVNRDDPPFLTYFVDLPVENSSVSLLENLKQPGHAVVYGGVGSGKTMLRYALEAQCRGMSDRILVVSQPMGKGEPKSTDMPLSPAAFAEALATDLFVQTLEQFDSLLNRPDAELTEELSHYWHTNIPNFHRNLERHLAQGQPVDAPTGISVWWRTWKRIVVRYTPFNTARMRFLTSVLTLGEKRETTGSHNNFIQQGCHLAHRLGYKQLFYLIDVAGTSQLNTTKLIEQLYAIANWLPLTPDDVPISLKLFLPERLKEILQAYPEERPAALISPSFSAIIEWNHPELLQALIANRFRSAGSWIQGIEVLASQEIAVVLPNQLVKAANESPRRLLQIVNQLIRAHVERDAGDPTITTDDWQAMRMSWPYGSPPLPSLLSTTRAQRENYMSNGISTHEIRRDFDERLYVEREVELALAKEWLKSTRRILTITSPPANGKTWFLTRFYNFLNHEEKQHAFHIDVRYFLTEGALGKREIDHVRLQQWTEDFVAKLRQHCPSAPSSTDAAEAASVLNTLSDYISTQCWPGQPIYLFVDGGDEPSIKSWREIENKVLVPILTQPNWHLIVTLRQFQRLHAYLLRQTEQPLKLLPLPNSVMRHHPGHVQLQKLIDQSPPPTPSFDDVIHILPDYNWIQPGLNHFLFLEAYQCFINHQKVFAGDDLLKRGVSALTPLSNTEQIVSWLKTISKMTEEWRIEELVDILGQSRITTWQIINILQEHLLITNTDNRYRITDGVREFICAAQALEQI
jgi:hypothetical protein